MEIVKLFKITYYQKTTNALPINNRLYELAENVSTRWVYREKEHRILINKGFKWDGATIPRAFWSILGYFPSGLLLTPSLWHDEIYKKKGWVFCHIALQSVHVNRLHCDQLFYMHMIQSGVTKKDATKLYKIVRRFGWWYWKDFSKGWIKRIFK